MTTSFQQLENYISDELKTAEEFFTTEEGKVIAYLTPLADQIVMSVKALGKATFDEGLQVLVDAAKAAVKAGAAAAPVALATGSPEGVVAAAEAAFIATGVSEGKVALTNAEEGLVKATVAIVQQDAPVVPAPDAPSEPAA